MAFDQDNQGIPTPNINPQPAQPTEQDVRTMRADLGTPVGLPTFDAEEPAFTPETTNQIPSVDQLVAEGGHSKKPLWLIGGVAGFLVLGLVGYFFVAPMFNKAPSTDTEAPAVVPPTTKPVVQPAVTPPVQPVAVHKTQFINPPVTTITVAVASVGANEIKGVLASQGQTAKQGLTEIVFTDADGKPVSFGAVLAAVGADFHAGQTDVLKQDLSGDATVFIYKDSNGVWPGYIGEGSVAQANAISNTTAWLEGNGMLSSFFIVNPGTIASFKNGTVGNLPDRYAPGTTPGASFGYLTTKNKLLISTSYAGMKEALRLMGL